MYSPHNIVRWVSWGVVDIGGCTLTAGGDPFFGMLGKMALSWFKLGGLGNTIMASHISHNGQPYRGCHIYVYSYGCPKCELRMPEVPLIENIIRDIIRG